ncbi:MAG: DUF1592 domain-containing protein [Polyangiaceae bacterium]|nr:DUF1592 domain-containing protein [Polyangiaceae bacterium]
MRMRLAGGVLALALLGCTGQIGDPEGSAPAGAQQAVVSGARRLSRNEYDNTLRALLDDKTSSGFAKLPEDVNDPFDNDYGTQLVSAALVEAAETLATEAAARAIADPAVRAKIVPCSPTGAGDTACLRKFITSFGRRALRRPLLEEEIQRYLAFSSYAVEENNFDSGVELVLRSLLQDVEFLYRIEIGEPVSGAPGVFRLNDFEVATRLSYFLLGTTPDDSLLDLAASGKLRTPADIRAAAATLLTDSRARERIERFHALWLGFHQLPHPAELTSAMRAESAALIDRVIFDEKLDYFELFRSNETFLNDYLADHYSLPAPSTSEGGWVSYGDSGRQGILSHGSVLSAFGKFADTSPTQRGIFVRTRLLCEPLNPPPPNVNADQPPEGGSATCKVDKYIEHASVGSCKACHMQMDPIGFGLENYDKAGRYRAFEEGKPECAITGDGVLDGVGEFNGPAELADLLIESGKLEPCLVRQVYRFAVGRRERSEDLPILKDVEAKFTESGHAFDALLLDIVSTESFGYRKQEE